MKIALLTCQKLPNLTESDQLLIPELLSLLLKMNCRMGWMAFARETVAQIRTWSKVRAVMVRIMNLLSGRRPGSTWRVPMPTAMSSCSCRPGSSGSGRSASWRDRPRPACPRPGPTSAPPGVVSVQPPSSMRFRSRACMRP